MNILNIQRMSTEDGPGIRTTLFVKGCPLSCTWCHNPESISPLPRSEWIAVRCMGCLTCVKVCQNDALHNTNEGIVIDQNNCKACGDCVEECPTGALEIKGRQRDVEWLFKELIKDKAYWGKEGGVTLSGGEITMQAKEAVALLKKLHDAGINTAVDTCGFCSLETLNSFLEYTDILLYDLKIFDNETHKKYMGQGNEIIIKNFLEVAQVCKERNITLWVRTPIIPGATDSDENIASLAKLISNRAHLWELCAFNNLCQDKYERLDKEWDFKDSPLMTKQRMEALVKLAKANGVKKVKWSGLTAREG